MSYSQIAFAHEIIRLHPTAAEYFLAVNQGKCELPTGNEQLGRYYAQGELEAEHMMFQQKQQEEQAGVQESAAVIQQQVNQLRG